MRFLAFAATVLCAGAAAAQSWVRGFGLSDIRYVVSVNYDFAKNAQVYRGIYLTSFPCYSSTATQYYETLPERNRVQIFCLQPPEDLYFSYNLRPINRFVSKNERWDGYFKCKVQVRSLGINGVIPRLEVNLDDCEKREINRAGNAEMVRFAGDMVGRPVGELRAVVAGEDIGPADAFGVQHDVLQYETQAGQIGSIAHIEKIEL